MTGKKLLANVTRKKPASGTAGSSSQISTRTFLWIHFILRATFPPPRVAPTAPDLHHTTYSAPPPRKASSVRVRQVSARSMNKIGCLTLSKSRPRGIGGYPDALWLGNYCVPGGVLSILQMLTHRNHMAAPGGCHNLHLMHGETESQRSEVSGPRQGLEPHSSLTS